MTFLDKILDEALRDGWTLEVKHRVTGVTDYEARLIRKSEEVSSAAPHAGEAYEDCLINFVKWKFHEANKR